MPAASVDDYLASLPDGQHRALAPVRATMLAAAPEAVESIAYGMAAYKYRGKPRIYFDAAKHHIALYGNNGPFAF